MGKSRFKKLESDLWAIMRDGMKPHGPHMQRIESNTGWGIPDVNCAYKGKEFWCELKVIDGNKIHFQPGQPGWLTKRWNTGCLSWVLARKTTSKADEIYVWPGRDAIKLDSDGLDVEPYFHTWRIGSGTSFPWLTILECMCERV
jgi:hypothetical protein